MSYETVVQVSYMATIILFGAIFAGVIVYAFWPGNRMKFERASRMPLDRDEDTSANGMKP